MTNQNELKLNPTFRHSGWCLPEEKEAFFFFFCSMWFCLAEVQRVVKKFGYITSDFVILAIVLGVDTLAKYEITTCSDLSSSRETRVNLTHNTVNYPPTI